MFQILQTPDLTQADIQGVADLLTAEPPLVSARDAEGRTPIEALASIGSYRPKRVACNIGASGSTGRHFKVQTHLTEPQGKIKNYFRTAIFPTFCLRTSPLRAVNL